MLCEPILRPSSVLTTNEIHRWAFFITFGGYFMAHFSRKCYSTVKQQLEVDAGYSPLLLSEMDTGTFVIHHCRGVLGSLLLT